MARKPPRRTGPALRCGKCKRADADLTLNDDGTLLLCHRCLTKEQEHRDQFRRDGERHVATRHMQA